MLPFGTQETEPIELFDEVNMGAPLALVVLTGASPQCIPLPESGEIIIGRSRACGARIDCASVSRAHACVRVEGGGRFVRVEDLGSANGSVLAGDRLAPGRPTPMRAGDVLAVGSATLMLSTRGEPAPEVDISEIVVSSEAMRSVHELVARVATSRLNVLLLGETGVGKEVLAERVHLCSGARRSQRLVRINCAALNEGLLESELFGHERGAFTGAVSEKPGIFETASGGTVFLDEVGDMPLSIQAKLLRVIEDGCVVRVGSVEPRRVDTRVVAATNRDLEAMIEQQTFRRDLYFRLNGVTITVPPLRARVDEIVPLALWFIERAREREGGWRDVALDEAARDWLRRFSWPGNVRQLRNVIERALVLCDGAITAAHLRSDAGDASAECAGLSPVQVGERDRILSALSDAAGNQTRAAKLLGISRGTLMSRLDVYGIRRPRKRRPRGTTNR